MVTFTKVTTGVGKPKSKIYVFIAPFFPCVKALPAERDRWLWE